MNNGKTHFADDDTIAYIAVLEERIAELTKLHAEAVEMFKDEAERVKELEEALRDILKDDEFCKDNYGNRWLDAWRETARNVLAKHKGEV